MWNLKHAASHLYHQYELITGVNMFEPWEKKLINGFFLIMVVLVVFSSYVYLPSYMETLLEVIKPTAGSNQPSEKAYVPLKISSF